MTWQEDNNERVAAVEAELRRARESLLNAARGCLAFPRDNVTVDQVRKWALDTAALAEMEASVIRRLLV